MLLSSLALASRLNKGRRRKEINKTASKNPDFRNVGLLTISSKST